MPIKNTLELIKLTLYISNPNTSKVPGLIEVIGSVNEMLVLIVYA